MMSVYIICKARQTRPAPDVARSGELRSCASMASKSCRPKPERWYLPTPPDGPAQWSGRLTVVRGETEGSKVCRTAACSGWATYRAMHEHHLGRGIVGFWLEILKLSYLEPVPSQLEIEDLKTNSCP